jgi:phosphatidylserine/phosphatidylglycerophosphate/cardiolipin synthase-like enzyme
VGQISSKVLDENSGPLAGFIVEVKSKKLFAKSTFTKTDPDGSFKAQYDDGKGLEYRVYDPVMRLLRADTIDDPSTFGEITINSKDAAGWLATLGKGAPVPVRLGNKVELLIDNEIAWPRIFDVIKAATQKIQVSQFEFYVDSCIENINMPVKQNVELTGDNLEELLEKRASNDNLTVDVLVHRSILATCEEVEHYFGMHSDKVAVRSLGKSFFAPLHAKLVIVDEKTALLLGSPFMQIFYNGQDHLIDDPRRGVENFSVGIEVPIHEVSCRIDGPAVGDVRDAFVLGWNNGLLPPIDENTPRQPGPPDQSTAVPDPVAGGDVPVQVVRSIMKGDFKEVPDGETGILEAYQRAIGMAEDFIYIETQYFTEEKIFDSLIAALNLKPKLQLIVVMNDDVDAPTFKRIQRNRVDRLRREVSDKDARIGVFELWTHGTEAGYQRTELSTPHDVNALIRCYVHSKVAVVDDKWATIGSANLDGSSLDKLKVYGELDIAPLVTGERSYEVNAIFFDGIAGQPSCTLPSELRRRLWAEHLGYTDFNHADLTNRPSDGWLSLWRSKALNKLRQFIDPTKRVPERVLFYDTACCSSALKLVVTVLEDVATTDIADAEKKQIKDKLRSDAIEVLTHLRTYDFSTGTFK